MSRDGYCQMIKKIFTFFLFSVAMMQTASAQDVVVPAGAEQPSASSEDAQKFLALTEEMIAVVRANEGNCEEMAVALRNLMSRNQEFLRSLDYTTQQADDNVIQQAHNNAEILGKLLGACYDNENIERLVSGWTSL